LPRANLFGGLFADLKLIDDAKVPMKYGFLARLF